MCGKYYALGEGIPRGQCAPEGTMVSRSVWPSKTETTTKWSEAMTTSGEGVTERRRATCSFSRAKAFRRSLNLTQRTTRVDLVLQPPFAPVSGSLECYIATTSANHSSLFSAVLSSLLVHKLIKTGKHSNTNNSCSSYKTSCSYNN